MSEHIISDLQIMANTENKLSEISEKIGRIESEYRNMKEYHEDTWGKTAKEEYYSKAEATSTNFLKLEENLRKEKNLISQARANYEKAESNSSKATESIAPRTSFSTANMFKN